MKETVQEYMQGIKRKLGDQDPLKLQAATVKKLARFIKGKSPAALRKRPAPDKWSAAEILAHLADVEVVQSSGGCVRNVVCRVSMRRISRLCGFYSARLTRRAYLPGI